jgi:uncharacterized protein (TIGR02302 family)
MIKSVLRSKRLLAKSAEEKELARRFESRVRLSRLALLAERLWEALLWPFVVAAVFLIVSLLDLFSLMPPLAHRIVLVAFGLALLVSLVPLVRLPLPTRAEALRRLEKTAGVRHRPASSYEDKLGTSPRGDTALLWAAHRERLGRLVAKLKPSWPAPRTDRKDPYALRVALLLTLIAVGLAAGPDRWNRLVSAFTPAPATATALLRLDAWVTPPVYTGMAPIVLADGSEKVGAGSESLRALSVPERSELIVRAYSPQGESVSLLTDTGDGTEAKAVTPKASGTQGLQEFNVSLNAPGAAEVKVGGATIAKWRFELIEDETPRIALIGNPTTTPRGALRLTFRAGDDHGVASAEAKFALAEPLGNDDGEITAAADPLREPPVMPLQLPKANAKQVEGRATQDLTAHPWAGLKVRMTLSARDQAGQTGMSEPYEFILPERKFTKPLAKAVVEQRKKLVRESDSVDLVARALDALTIGGEKVIDNSSVYLSLRDAYWRLNTDTSPESIGSVVEQLWNVALRIEDGDLPQAERDLKAAQDQLMKALKENASPEEIQRLVEELRSALSRYLQAMAQQQEQKGNLPPQASQNGDQLLSQQDLDKMLNSIENLAKAGSKELAQRMLNELKDILDQLQTGSFPDNAKQQRAAEMMRDLKDLTSQQQKLLDDTFKARREQGEGQEDEFEVSPPSQSMEFDPGMFINPYGRPQNESADTQGRPKGKQGRQEQSEQGGQEQSEQGEQEQSERGGNSPEQKKKQGKLDELSRALAKQQGDLRQKLQDLMDQMGSEGGNTPRPFEGAKQSMGAAKDALGESDLDQATGNQTRAIEQLRQGAQAMAEQMMVGGEQKGEQGDAENDRDPLGRANRTNSPHLGLSVKVPDQIDIQKAREVLDELRRRLGEPQRPAIELDYLERLIRPY